MTDYATEYAIVTGGSQGIGLAICRRLKVEGLVPVIFDRVAPEDASLGEFRAVDLSDKEATRAALDWALGLGPVSRLVNNVGTVMPALLEDTSLEDFDKLMALNVRCAIQCTQALAPGMRMRKMGRIVNIASRAALGKALRNNYSASKAALIGLTRTWSLELAPDGITVNCIPPGRIISEQILRNYTPEYRKWQSENEIPVGEYGQPDDIAGLVCYLVSPLARYITGTVIPVDGGLRRYQF